MSLQKPCFIFRRQYRDLNFRHQNSVSKLSHIAGRICEFARISDGSKFIICKLNEAREHQKNEVFNEIYPQLKTLMMDRFANLLIQKYFIIGNANQRLQLFSEIHSNIVELSLNEYGHYVVQKAIETASQQQLICFIKQFTEQNVVLLAKNANGNHVIQHILRSPMIVNHTAQVNF